MSGTYVPLMVLPTWMLIVGSFFPVKWMAQGFRSVLLPPEMVAFEPAGSWEHGRIFLVLAAWSIVGLLACLSVFRWSDRTLGTSMPPLLSITSHFFLQIAVILLTYRLLWPLFRRLAQVQVVAIMVAGFLLGPSVLGWIWPAAQQWLFPTKLTIGAETFTHPNLTAIYVVGQLGLVLYMFLVGASFKLDILGAHVRQAGVTSAAGIGVPLVLGGLVGWWMVSLGGYFTDKVRALAGRPVRRGRRGHHRVSDAGVDHLRLRPAQHPAGDDGAVLRRRRRRVRLGAAWRRWWRRPREVCSARFWPSEAGWPTCCSWSTSAVRCSARLETWTPPRADVERTGGLPIAHTSIILIVVLTASWFTDVVGIYSVFGAFVAGAVMPRGALLDAIRERFEPLVGYLLLPAFFIYSGLNTQLTLILDPSTLLMAGVVLVVSFAAKFGAIGLAARSQGMSWYEAGSMGALANARGLMELILLNIGFEAGLISGKLYTILALMTIITTFVATPLQRLFERRLQKSGSKFGPAGEEPHGEVSQAPSASGSQSASVPPSSATPPIVR